MKKILVYSHDTYGLGNIRRMMAVVEHMVNDIADVSILVLSGSPMMQAFRLVPGVDYIKMPCLARAENGTYSPKYLGLSHDSLLGLRADLILNTVLEFKPDLIVVDKKPLGVQNELAPTLDLLRRKADRPKLVLLLREILDNPENTIDVWERNKYHDVIKELYDKVLVLGSPEIFDTAAEYDFPGSTIEKLQYCGYIAKPPGERSKATIRNELGAGDRPLVLVTAGGGEDGFRLLSTFLQGRKQQSGSAFHSLIFVGPEMQVDQQQQLRGLAAEIPALTLLEFSNDVMSYMNAADVIVSMGGYNTITEILSLNKSAVVVPRIRPVEEQWIRATRLEQLELISVIHPDQLGPRRLFDAIHERLAPKRGGTLAGYRPPMNALVQVSACVQELIKERQELGWSQLLTNRKAQREASNRQQAEPAKIYNNPLWAKGM